MISLKSPPAGVEPSAGGNPPKEGWPYAVQLPHLKLRISAAKGPGLEVVGLDTKIHL